MGDRKHGEVVERVGVVTLIEIDGDAQARFAMPREEMRAWSRNSAEIQVGMLGRPKAVVFVSGHMDDEQRAELWADLTSGVDTDVTWTYTKSWDKALTSESYGSSTFMWTRTEGRP